MYNDMEEIENKFNKLNEKEQKAYIKNLRKRNKEIKEARKEYQTKKDELYKKFISLYDDEYKVDSILEKLTHPFKIRDIVILRTNEIAEIQDYKPNKKYKVFVHEPSFRSGIGTIQTVSEKDILCHIFDLLIKDFDYKEKGYRRLNKKWN